MRWCESARVSLQYSLQVKQILSERKWNQNELRERNVISAKGGETREPIIETHKSHKFSFDQNWKLLLYRKQQQQQPHMYRSQVRFTLVPLNSRTQYFHTLATIRPSKPWKGKGIKMKMETWLSCLPPHNFTRVQIVEDQWEIFREFYREWKEWKTLYIHFPFIKHLSTWSDIWRANGNWNGRWIPRMFGRKSIFILSEVLCFIFH